MMGRKKSETTIYEFKHGGHHNMEENRKRKKEENSQVGGN